MYVFVNHWKAKSEGEKVTESGRLKSATQLITRLKSIFATTPLADVVILGDFNEDVDEFVKAKGGYQTAFIPADNPVALPATLTGELLSQSTITLTGNPALTAPTQANICLYEPWYEMAGQARGSYVFRGQWFTLDHILLSAGLFNADGFQYQPKQFNCMRAEFLLDPQTGYPLKESFHTNTFPIISLYC